jgi:cold shock CspA family protein
MRGDVKVHEHPHAAGRVTKLFSRSGYGIIEDAEGREVYFHRNSVLNGGFRRLEVGTPVRFVECSGDKGPQASTVIPEPARRTSRRCRAAAARTE